MATAKKTTTRTPSASSSGESRPKLRSSHAARGEEPKPKAKAGATATKRASTAGAKQVASVKKKTKSVLVERAKEAASEREAPELAKKTAKAAQAARARKADEVSGSYASEDARRMAVAIAMAALDRKAVGLEILDVAGKVDYADFVVLMTGRSDRHTNALAHAIEDSLRQQGRRALSVEGLPHGNWVLMDYGDVVVHVFQDDARSAYDLEGLWMDAQRLPIPSDRDPSNKA